MDSCIVKCVYCGIPGRVVFEGNIIKASYFTCKCPRPTVEEANTAITERIEQTQIDVVTDTPLMVVEHLHNQTLPGLGGSDHVITTIQYKNFISCRMENRSGMFARKSPSAQDVLKQIRDVIQYPYWDLIFIVLCCIKTQVERDKFISDLNRILKPDDTWTWESWLDFIWQAHEDYAKGQNALRRIRKIVY